MPARKSFFCRPANAQFSEGCGQKRRRVMRSRFSQKRLPWAADAVWRYLGFARLESDARIREVAVANRCLGADRSRPGGGRAGWSAEEQRTWSWTWSCSGLLAAGPAVMPYFAVAPYLMYTRYQKWTGLHSSNQDCAIQHGGVNESPIRPNKTAAEIGTRARLLRRLLARRVERAGIMNLGHLMVAEAEHLAQDFVGVLAEQRRPPDFAR